MLKNWDRRSRGPTHCQNTALNPQIWQLLRCLTRKSRWCNLRASLWCLPLKTQKALKICSPPWKSNKRSLQKVRSPISAWSTKYSSPAKSAQSNSYLSPSAVLVSCRFKIQCEPLTIYGKTRRRWICWSAWRQIWLQRWAWAVQWALEAPSHPCGCHLNSQPHQSANHANENPDSNESQDSSASHVKKSKLSNLQRLSNLQSQLSLRP